MYLCNGYSRCLFSSVSHLSVFMGSFDAGLVLDLAQNIIFTTYLWCTISHLCIPFYRVRVFWALHLEDTDHVYSFSGICPFRTSLVHARSCFLPAFTPLFDLVQPAQFCCCKALVSRPSRCEAPAGQRWSMGCRSPLTRLRVLLKAQYACCCFCISTHTHSFAPHVFRTVPFLCRPAEGAS